MRIGTKSLLFGYHQFLLHPLLVGLAWWDLYGFPADPRLWVAFLVHDWGYWGKPNMDGNEGEDHPYAGARVMEWLFDDGWLAKACDALFGFGAPGCANKAHRNWYLFTYYHSRFAAKKWREAPSRLCWADKHVIARTWTWLQLATMLPTGEWREYKHHDGSNGRTTGQGKTLWRWCEDMRATCRAAVREGVEATTTYRRTIRYAGQGRT